jgi:iron complex outermembrane receptor protein
MVAALLCAASSATLSAQSTASITGTVLDATGKSIPSAEVAIRNAAGAPTRTTSDREGQFKFSGLSADVYTVEASSSGFAPAGKVVQLAAGATENVQLTLNVGAIAQSVTVEASGSLAVQNAVSLTPLDVTTAESVITSNFIQNYVAPTGDYSDVVAMSPGTFSVSSNGPGLGDTKIFFRGFKDGLYNMTFDGLPFNDTNDPTHHSWVWFPNAFLGSTVFDRSPGDATAIGPSNAGGAINLQSKEMSPDMDLRASVSYGSFNTKLISIDYDSGPFGGRYKDHNLILNMHELSSDGYQTYNYQNRWGGSAKYQYRLTDKTVLTAFTGITDVAANTPNVKGPTRAAVAQFGNNYLLNNDPNSPLYYKYSWYQIPTDFDYVGISSDLGSGWKLENKVYSNRYYNHQQYDGSTITATSGTDKLNSYRKFGDSFFTTWENKWGVMHIGTWYEWANTDRYQIPTDPRTWVDAAVPNFHEKFRTQSFQPYIQYEYHLTKKLSVAAGFKINDYNIILNQYADNGKTIGNLGGLAFVTHSANYVAYEPNASVRYRVKSNWSAYAQYAAGNIIPPSSVFDVKNANVKTTPKPTQTKTFQCGSVAHFNRVTLDMATFFIHADNAYTSAPDPVTGEPVYYSANATISKGFEAESNVVIGHGLNMYANVTFLSAKYSDNHLWVANSPQSTTTVATTYQRRNWDVGFFNKRIGQMWNDNGGTNQAVKIEPFWINNMFFNYTMKDSARFRGTKFRISVNNLFDQHSITGVTPASTSSNLPAPGDTLTLMAGRSVSFTVTFGYLPKR